MKVHAVIYAKPGFQRESLVHLFSQYIPTARTVLAADMPRFMAMVNAGNADLGIVDFTDDADDKWFEELIEVMRSHAQTKYILICRGGIGPARRKRIAEAGGEVAAVSSSLQAKDRIGEILIRVVIREFCKLSRREHEILLLIGMGMKSREIADILKIRTSTVLVHRRNISKKIGTGNPAQQARLSMLLSHSFLKS